MNNYSYYPDVIRVSEAIGCLRKSFYNRFSPKNQYTTCFSLYGKIAENTMKALLPRFHGWFENVVVRDGILMGHPDFVDYIHQRIIEQKFRWRRSVQISDLTQANAYACMLRFPQFTIRTSWLIYQPTLQIQFNDITFDTRYDLYQKFKEKAQCLLNAIKSKKVELIRTYPQWTWECRYCPHTECEKNKGAQHGF